MNEPHKSLNREEQKETWKKVEDEQIYGYLINLYV